MSMAGGPPVGMSMGGTASGMMGGNPGAGGERGCQPRRLVARGMEDSAGRHAGSGAVPSGGSIVERPVLRVACERFGKHRIAGREVVERLDGEHHSRSARLREPACCVGKAI